MLLVNVVLYVLAQTNGPGGGGTDPLILILPTLGVVLVAFITGVFNWLQARAANRAKTAAATSAQDAESYAKALSAKTAAIDGLEEQVEVLKELREQDALVIAELREHVEECVEAERAASLLQRELSRRVEELEAKVA